ncbi:hypothetical protein BGAL_0114g00070 [Botrytis galanthina]|uniref:Uncharacterized protein n=1 Tax=Botrytis galanthina TaxID=278940 RepID=A0A4S8R592_9HELO|nr:hypothetical protein BGAL_0114g00070 [Botrytis galanthina]
MEIEAVLDQADPPPSLNTLPLEVRFKIFKELLINPVLGELKSILGNYQVQAPNDGIKYHLHPSILRTIVKYGHPRKDKDMLTPLLRYGSSYRQEGLNCKEIKAITQPAFKKVRQWTMIISPYTIRTAVRPEWEHNLFKLFCDLVFGVPIRRLEVILWDLAVLEHGEELMEPRQTFLPLTILRNVGNLTIREAALDEFPPSRHNSRFSQPNSKLLLAYADKSNLLDKKSYKKLKRLVETAIEEDKDRDQALDLEPRGRYFQTYEAARLLILIEKYAAAFERDQDEKTEIAFRVERKENKSFRMDHPIEMMLRRLGSAFEHERWDLFIDAFKDLLGDLQAQFSEIKQTWRDLFKSDTHGNTMCSTEYDSDSGSLDGMIDLQSDNQLFGSELVHSAGCILSLK